LLVTLTDCSAREAAERELETLLSELRATLDSAADGMLVCTLDGQIRAFNQRFVQLWSLPQSLLVQRNDAALQAHMAQRVSDPQAYRAAIQALECDPQADACEVLELCDGTLLERRSVPQRSHGVVVGRVYSFRDITRDVQAQAALRLAGRVFEASPYPIFVADAQHHSSPGQSRLRTDLG
jgi:PAS domain-containing protein